LTAGRKSYVSVGSTRSLGGSGCLEKLKRGLVGPGRMVVSFAGVGRKDRVSREGALVLAILHTARHVSPCLRPVSPCAPRLTWAWRNRAGAPSAPAAPLLFLAVPGWSWPEGVALPTWRWRRSSCAAGCHCRSSSGICALGPLRQHISIRTPSRVHHGRT
jgi:hypothetical protein